jgi:GNAT superfamily N-acetyltransferase
MISMNELARLEEGRLALSISEIAAESRRFSEAEGGGVLCRGVPGTWVNVGVGMGLAGPVPDRVVGELVEWFVSHGAEPRVELCPVADPSLIEALAARSFVVSMFENVFYRELAPGQRTEAPHALPSGIVIEPVDPADDRTVKECAHAVVSGFAGDRAPTAPELDLWLGCMRHPRTFTLAARAGDRVVGGGSVELHAGAAALFGLSVLPEYRRKGIQQALIAARLDHAAHRGAACATISARPGVATERNARRLGFALGYSKVILTRPGPGLAPVRG